MNKAFFNSRKAWMFYGFLLGGLNVFTKIGLLIYAFFLFFVIKEVDE